MTMSGDPPATPADQERGARIRRLREELDLGSQEKVAKAIGLNREGYLKVENGTNKFTAPVTQQALAQLVGVSLGVMVEYARGQLTLEELLAARRNSAVPGASTDPVGTEELETCLKYHGAERWPPEAVAAARTLSLKREKRPTSKEWETILDGLSAALDPSIRAMSEWSDDEPAAPPPPKPRKRRS